MTIVWVNGSPQNTDGSRYDPFADPANYRNGVYAPNQEYINPDHPVWYGDPNPSSPYYNIYPYTFTTEPSGELTILSGPPSTAVGLIEPSNRTPEQYTQVEEKKTVINGMTTTEYQNILSQGLSTINPIYSAQGQTLQSATLGSVPTAILGSNTQASIFGGIFDGLLGNTGKMLGYGALAYGAFSMLRRKRGIFPLLALAYGLYVTGIWKQIFPQNSDGSLNVASTLAIATNPVAGLTASGLIPAGVAILGMVLPYIMRSFKGRRNTRRYYSRSRVSYYRPRRRYYR